MAWSVGRWSPWDAAAEMDEVEVVRAILPNGVRGACARVGDQVVIVLDQRLDEDESTVVLAHELVHLERDSLDCCFWGQVDGHWTGLQVREELAVNREVARRLVPPDELAAWTRGLVGCGQQVTVGMIAERFEVTAGVASIAAELYQTRRSGWPRFKAA